MTLIYKYISPDGCAHRRLNIVLDGGRQFITCPDCYGLWEGVPDVPREESP
ncbi:MAG: hypothetical protein J4G04_07645 [Nitrosopumilaceae archaeon]|nr:hypothetical protein [Nitrosopumilaceae archaeon]